jgi:nicotinamide-nucleotide amidase
MNKTVKAEIISIGTELLRGEITDTNAVYIASQLPLAGIELRRMNTAGDDIKMLAQAIRQSLKRSSVVITTGGLGPTHDDLTREAIALVLEEELFSDTKLETQLRANFARLGREMPLSNLRQAMRINSASSLPNPRGTAPGWWVEKNDKVIAVMPGPPREMVPMWQNEVLPRLNIRFSGGTILSRTIKTFSLQEAKVGEMIQPFVGATNPTLGIYAKPDGIQIRLIAQGNNASQLLDTTAKKIEEILTSYVWGKDNETLEGIIGHALYNQGMSLATIEGFTGGLLGHIISESALSSQFYRGGVIDNSNYNNISLGTPDSLIKNHGIVTGERAEAKALSIREKISTDIGLSVSEIYHNRGASNQSDMVYIGIADANGTKSWQQQFMLNRADSRERAAVAALFRLRERLLEMNILDYVK